MARIAALILCLLATSAAAAEKHTCRCIYDKGEVEEGKTACLKTADGYRLARCEMVLNNTSWTFLDQPCDKQLSRSTFTFPENG